MSRHILTSLASLCAVLALGACSSARVGGYGSQPYSNAAAEPTMTMQQPVEAVPSASVTSEPLPPIDGQPLPPIGGYPPVGTSEPTEIAGLPPVAAPAPAAASPGATRNSMVGNWTAKDASGSSCRIQLSSSPALDLYRASGSGCSNSDLSKINAWDYRNGEVYLYQQGGSVAARLRGSANDLKGLLAKSGAPLTLGR